MEVLQSSLSSLGVATDRQKIINLKPYQTDFVFNKTEFPGFVAGWGSGKTLCAILRGLLYVELIPGSVGMVFRKQATDLTDSTIADFIELTGKKPNSHRNVIYPNGSKIMFRHIEEVNPNILQNVNLDWFFIEQAEELASDEQFFLLWGRFKKQRQPTQAFLDLGLPFHSGWITANVKGKNWVRALWKDDPEAKQNGFDLIEAITQDNIDNLDDKYKARIELLKRLKPNLYQRFCLNDWDVTEADKLFHRDWFEVVNASPVLVGKIRYWDRAATQAPRGKVVNASWTAGVKMGRTQSGVFYITDVVRFQGSPLNVESTIKNVASQDGCDVRVGIEQDPGQAGKAEAEHYIRLLAGHKVTLNTVRESKGLRVSPLSAQVEAGNVKLVKGSWNEPFLRELENFDESSGCMSDQVDASSGAFHLLTLSKKMAGTWGR